MFVPKKGMSNVWSGITENAKVLCEGMRMAVGNGARTLFWDHKWATSKPLCELVTQAIPSELAGVTVEELWDKDFGWKWDQFAPYLSTDVLKQIQAYELKADPSIGDLVYWQGTSKGKFSIKSAIRLIRNESESLDEDCWDAIWRTPVQQRIRAFLWLVCHDRILGNANRFKRQMTDDPKCFICGAEEETTLHILRDCPAAKVIWKKIGGPATHSTFYNALLKPWVTDNCRGGEASDGEIWSTYFGIVAWWLWKWRNGFVFDRNFKLPMDVSAFLQIRFDETRRCIQALEEEGNNNKVVQVQKYVRWRSPAIGWYVLNCDGAAKGAPGPAGGGGLIRDHQGSLVSAFSANFGSCLAYKAEVLAVARGISLARNLGISKLEIHLDNLACVQFLNNKETGTGDNAHELNYCRSMLEDSSWEVKVLHVYREGNRAADWLANHGVTPPIY